MMTVTTISMPLEPPLKLKRSLTGLPLLRRAQPIHGREDEEGYALLALC
jgi:hypothetical protein